MSQNSENARPPPSAPKPDVHGTGRLVSNVLWSWAGQLVLIVSGFLIPRLIAHELGQERLGVWDFSWAVVSHFAIINFGVISSINRFIARYRAQQDIENINRVASCGAVLLRAMGATVVVTAALCAAAMPTIMQSSPAAYGQEARALVMILGTAVAVQFANSVYGGVLTGCHRWNLHNAVYAGTYGINLAGMVLVLHSDLGLIGLAGVMLTTEILAAVARRALAYRTLPYLQIQTRRFDKGTAYEMFRFGGKTIVGDLGALLVTQTVSLMIASYLGPALLTLYARPMSLIRIIGSFMAKYSTVLVPTASSLDGSGQRDTLSTFASAALKNSIFLSLPVFVGFAILGPDVITLWMGPEYSQGGVVATLAITSFFSQVNSPLHAILIGANMHGRIGIVLIFGAVVSVTSGYLSMRWLGAQLPGIVLAVTVPWALFNFISVPLYLARHLKIEALPLLARAWKGPVQYCVPYSAGLLAVMQFGPAESSSRLMLGMAVGAILLAVPYWLYVVPQHWKNRILETACRVLGCHRPSSVASSTDP